MSFCVKMYAEDRITYVPDFLSNRSAAEDWDGEGERPFFAVELLPMSSRDLNKIATKAVAGMRSRDEACDRAEMIMRRIFAKYVPSVRGLVLQGQDGELHRPSTGEDLFALSVGAATYIRENLIEDIYAALKDVSRAEAGDLKKLRSRCDGSAQEKTSSQQPATGGAQNATLPVELEDKRWRTG